MTKDEWKASITEATQSINTYRKEFDPVIDTLADILNRRDATFKEYMESGGESVVLVISDRGAENYRKNPRMQAWMDLNNQALAFWRDLGLNPAGLKKLNESALKPEKKEGGLAEAIRELGG